MATEIRLIERLGLHVRGLAAKGSFREFRLAVHTLTRNPLTLGSLVILAALGFIAIFAPVIIPYSPYKIDLDEKFQAPSIEHPFGTDYLGRDVLSRVMFGARLSLMAGVAIVLLSVSIGWPLGVIAGYRGGRVETVIMRVTDTFLAFPSLILALIIAFLLGPSLINSMIAISVTWWPWYTRLARADTVSLKERGFVEASTALGLSSTKIMFRHIFPNTMNPVIIQATMDLGTAIILAAALGFLGLGAQPPEPEWGLMVSDGRAVVFSAWWYAAFPGLFIFIAAAAFNLLGDGLRESLDPRLRRTRGA